MTSLALPDGAEVRVPPALPGVAVSPPTVHTQARTPVPAVLAPPTPSRVRVVPSAAPGSSTGSPQQFYVGAAEPDPAEVPRLWLQEITPGHYRMRLIP